MSAYEHMDLVMETFETSKAVHTFRIALGMDDGSRICDLSFGDSWCTAEQAIAIAWGLC
jgi:hypothetical protein